MKVVISHVDLAAFLVTNELVKLTELLKIYTVPTAIAHQYCPENGTFC